MTLNTPSNKAVLKIETFVFQKTTNLEVHVQTDFIKTKSLTVKPKRPIDN